MGIKNNKFKINVSARLSRHLRIAKENIWDNSEVARSRRGWSHHYGLVLFLVLLIVPIYPTLASFVYNTSRYDFYRWDIDESSIIESYYWWSWEKWDEAEWNNIFESVDSFISVNSILDDERDLEWTNEIVNYEVRPWDSFYSISLNFEVSTNSIYWANDFDKNHVLHPWDIIKVPPVTWMIHQVKSWETLSSIAEKYDIGESKIKEQNWLWDDSKVIAWEVLVIPWAVKPAPPVPVYVKPAVNYPKSKATAKSSGSKAWTSTAVTSSTTSTWKYKLSRRNPSHSFVWWNCTRYVAQYKNVKWWWNANQWLKNAAAAWYSTWSTPSLWAIVQLTGRWYNPRYWHVWIVMDIVWNDIIISDMNYRMLNEITYRKIPINDRTIDWYIYVD